MAETAGEYTIFMILFVITAIVIIAIFGVIALESFGVAQGNLCIASGLIRNFIYSNFGLNKGIVGFVSSVLFPFGTALSYLNVLPPLYCSPSYIQYTKNYSAFDIWQGVSEMAINCLNQYGFNQSLYVNYNGPLLCGVVSLNLDHNLSFSSFIEYLKNKTINITSNNCLDNPQLCNVNEGYVCNTANPTQCEKPISNFSVCIQQPNYVPTEPGYVLKQVPLYCKSSSSSCTSAYQLIAPDLCEASEGCAFNPNTGNCTNSQGVSSVCSQPWQNYCSYSSSQSQWICNVQCTNLNGQEYCLPPLGCYSYYNIPKQPVKQNGYDYLFPGGFTLVYIYNPITGINYQFPSAENLNIRKATIYLYYLNSFTGSYLPPKSYSSPNGCPQFTIFNSISLNCLSSCTTVIGAGVLGSSRKLVALGTGVAITGAIVSLPVSYLASTHVIPASPGQLALTSAELTFFPVMDCLQCIQNSILEHVQNGLVLTSSRLLMCIDVNYTS